MTSQTFRDSLTEAQVLEILERMNTVAEELVKEFKPHSDTPVEALENSINVGREHVRRIVAVRLKGPAFTGSFITIEDARHIVAILKPELTDLKLDFEDEDHMQMLPGIVEREILIHTMMVFGAAALIRFPGQTCYESIWQQIETTLAVLNGEPIQGYNTKHAEEATRRLHTRDEYIYRSLVVSETCSDIEPLIKEITALMRDAALALKTGDDTCDVPDVVDRLALEFILKDAMVLLKQNIENSYIEPRKFMRALINNLADRVYGA